MNKSKTATKRQLLVKLVEERCGTADFLLQTGMSKSRFHRLLSGAAEAKQSEMLRTAEVLKLSESEFFGCFFNK